MVKSVASLLTEAHVQQTVREIALTKGYVTKVDAADYDRLMQHNWCVVVSKSRHSFRVYAARGCRIEGKQVMVLMHREIVGVGDGSIDVDHRDGDTLNNQRHNLRVSTRAQNNANSKKRGGKSSSRFKGVHLHESGKWSAQIRKRHLGQFDTEEEAAAAYDQAAKEEYREWYRPNLLERDVERQVCDFLLAEGWRVFKTEHVFSEAKLKVVGEIGMPDRLAIRYLEPLTAKVLWLEIKRPSQKPTAHQLAWHAAERDRGALVLVVDDIDEFIAWYNSSGLRKLKWAIHMAR